ARRRPREVLFHIGKRVGARVERRDELVVFSIKKEHVGIETLAELHHATRDGVEHGLRVRGRAGDYLEDLARRRQVPVPRLQFSEQPRVLDGNDRLVGEGLEQGDLLLGELSRLGPVDGDHSDRRSVAEHWHPDNASKTAEERILARVLRIGEQIRKLDDTSTENSASGHLGTARTHRVPALQPFERLHGAVVVRAKLEDGAVESKYGSAVCP